VYLVVSAVVVLQRSTENLVFSMINTTVVQQLPLMRELIVPGASQFLFALTWAPLVAVVEVERLLNITQLGDIVPAFMYTAFLAQISQGSAGKRLQVGDITISVHGVTHEGRGQALRALTLNTPRVLAVGGSSANRVTVSVNTSMFRSVVTSSSSPAAAAGGFVTDDGTLVAFAGCDLGSYSLSLISSRVMLTHVLTSFNATFVACSIDYCTQKFQFRVHSVGFQPLDVDGNAAAVLSVHLHLMHKRIALLRVSSAAATATSRSNVTHPRRVHIGRIH
jgi:hypothetical protein